MPTMMESVILPLLGTILAIGFAWLFAPAITASMSKDSAIKDETSVHSSRKQPPSLSVTSPPPLLSLIIPAYEEEHRIQKMLQDARDFLDSKDGDKLLYQLQTCAKMAGYHDDIVTPLTNDFKNGKIIVEWLVVNDGSRDQTVNVANSFLNKLDRTKHHVRVLSLKVNSGKGAAVQNGMMKGMGIFRLMVDADGATEFGPGLQRTVQELEKKLTMANNKRLSSSPNDLVAIFGSRAHLQQEATKQRSLIRSLLMYAFHFFVNILVSSKIKDTQCGFKLFTKSSVELIFETLHLHRWAFDIEVVMIAEMAGIDIAEVDVPWHEIDGSKLNTSRLALAIVCLTMLRDMICVRICYMTRIWKVQRRS